MSLPIVGGTSQEEDELALAAARDWRRTRVAAGFGWISGPVSYGGLGLGREHEVAFDQLEQQMQRLEQFLVYTDDSHLGTAAVHAGVLKEGEWGIVEVTILPGRASFTGSTQHGVTSDDFGPFDGSYRVEHPRASGLPQPTAAGLVDVGEVSVDGAARQAPLIPEGQINLFGRPATSALELRRIMDAAGVLADFLEVETRYESVVEEFLSDELNYVVVKSWDSANEGMRLLQSDVDGRATFLVHPEDSQAKFSFVANDAPPPSSPRHEEIVSLKNCIRVLDGFGRSLEVVLPKLRDGYLAPDSETARRLAMEYPHGYFLAPTGEYFHSSTVSGGKPAAEGPLAVKRELRETQKKLEKVEAELGQAEINAVAAARAIEELVARLELLSEQRRQAERHDVETEEKVLAEEPLLNQNPQVLVGGRDDAHVGLDRGAPADRGVLALLQHA